MTTSVASSPDELNTTDGSLTTTLTLGAAATPAPSAGPAPTPKPAKPTPPSFAALTLFAVKPILLHTRKPSLHLNLKASKPTQLTLTLRDRQGHKLATWHKHAAMGKNSYTCSSPLRPGKPVMTSSRSPSFATPPPRRSPSH